MTTHGELPDIVERLRERRGILDNRWPGPTALELEAADLIERLRATPPGSPLEREADAIVDEQEFLRGLVDWVYLHATEGEQWPSTYTADALITAAHQGKPTQANANAYKTLATPSPSPTEREGE